MLAAPNDKGRVFSCGASSVSRNIKAGHNPSSAENLLESIEAKLLLLNEAVSAGKSMKRNAGARVVKAASAAAPPSTTGKLNAVSAIANVQHVSPTGGKATRAEPGLSLTLPSASASAFRSRTGSSLHHDGNIRAAGQPLAAAACLQPEVAPLPPTVTVTAHPPSVPCIDITLRHAEATCSSPELDSVNSSTERNSPPTDIFASIEANLALLSSVVVPAQFKKRALGTRLQQRAAQPAAAAAAATASKVYHQADHIQDANTQKPPPLLNGPKATKPAAKLSPHAAKSAVVRNPNSNTAATAIKTRAQFMDASEQRTQQLASRWEQ